MRSALCFAVALILSALTAPAHAAEEMADGGKLLLTGGVSNIEGAGGGGLATWALTTGYATRDGIGANAHAIYVDVGNYRLRSYGAAAGFFDRVEVSIARQQFDTGPTGAKLGLGKGFTFNQDVVGAKVRLLGNAVYDQDSWLPQVAVGAQFKYAEQNAIVRAVGAHSTVGIDYYVSATKLVLADSLLLNVTVRATKANQTGLLGFGGDRSDNYSLETESSAAFLVTRHLAVGAEYRTKPNNLGFARENDWYDVFAAYAVNKHLSLTVAYVNLGDIATFRNQQGLYVSLQAGF